MRDIDLERKAVQRLALKPTGINPRLDRIFSGQVGSLQADAAIMALPFPVAGQALQDPTTGALYAMYDVDTYGATYAS
jgi:monoamine oxidase